MDAPAFRSLYRLVLRSSLSNHSLLGKVSEPIPQNITAKSLLFSDLERDKEPLVRNIVSAIHSEKGPVAFLENAGQILRSAANISISEQNTISTALSLSKALEKRRRVVEQLVVEEPSLMTVTCEPFTDPVIDGVLPVDFGMLGLADIPDKVSEKAFGKHDKLLRLVISTGEHPLKIKSFKWMVARSDSNNITEIRSDEEDVVIEPNTTFETNRPWSLEMGNSELRERDSDVDRLILARTQGVSGDWVSGAVSPWRTGGLGGVEAMGVGRVGRLRMGIYNPEGEKRRKKRRPQLPVVGLPVIVTAVPVIELPHHYARNGVIAGGPFQVYPPRVI